MGIFFAGGLIFHIAAKKKDWYDLWLVTYFTLIFAAVGELGNWFFKQ